MGDLGLAQVGTVARLFIGARRCPKSWGCRLPPVLRIWQKYGVQPHRLESFKFSRDPEFDAKLADIWACIWTHPNALALCVDEESQIHAFNPHTNGAADVA